MSPADLYLLGLWQGQTGYNVAAAYAFHPCVPDDWMSLVALETAAFESLASPPLSWAASRAVASLDPASRSSR